MAKAKVEVDDVPVEVDDVLVEADLDESFTGELLPGMVVLWYKEAKKHARPLPAVVNCGYPGGICDLSFIGSSDRKEGVYHTGDPRLCDHFGKMSDNALRYGAWGFTPWTKDDYLKYVVGTSAAE